MLSTKTKASLAIVFFSTALAATVIQYTPQVLTPIPTPTTTASPNPSPWPCEKALRPSVGYRARGIMPVSVWEQSSRLSGDVRLPDLVASHLTRPRENLQFNKLVEFKQCMKAICLLSNSILVICDSISMINCSTFALESRILSGSFCRVGLTYMNWTLIYPFNY